MTLEEKFRAHFARLDVGVVALNDGWEVAVRGKRVRQYRRLAKMGISTIPDVLAKYDTLHRRTQRIVLDLVGYTGDRRVVPLLVRVFNEDPVLRGDTINPLSFLGGKRAYKFTRSVIERELAAASPDPAFLKPAYWALHNMVFEREEALDLLLEVFAREEVSADIRSSVLDCLGMELPESDRRTSIYRRGRQVVLKALTDPEAEVRFFAIYAVGTMGLTEALPRLRRMARTDRGASPGLWTVAEEASDVISLLTTGWWPDREPQTGRILDEPPEGSPVKTR